MDVSDVAVHLASQNPHHRGGRSNRGSYYNNSGRGSSFNREGYRSRGRGSFLTGRGSYNRGSSSTCPLCQICNRLGHVAIDCYQRYEEHTTTREPHPLMQANFSIPTGGLDQNWYLDSGATHHLTSDLQNLNHRYIKYIGSDQVHMSNGTGLTIQNMGDTFLSSPNASFLLHNVLHVPSITKKLLFVHKFTFKTNTFIKFHPWFFFVKEQGSGKILLQCLNDRGLYKLPVKAFPSNPPLCVTPSANLSSSSFVSPRFASTHIGERTSPQNWHARLGHPAFRICFNVCLDLIYQFCPIIGFCHARPVTCQKANNFFFLCPQHVLIILLS